MGTQKTQEERITALEQNMKETKEFMNTNDNNLLFICKFLKERIRELEAKVEDLHSTDSARRLNMATEDPEWY